MKVLKFGGTSVKDKAAIDRIAAIIAKDNSKIIIVVSAIAGVTNLLEKINYEIENKRIGSALEIVELILKIHIVFAKDLDLSDETTVFIQNETESLRNYVKGIEYLGEFNPRIKDKILAKGEILSSFIISAYLNKIGLNTYHIDPRKALKTDSNFGNAAPDYFLTNLVLKKVCSIAFENNNIIVTGGFVGSDVNDETTTLGRGGSDYSASIFARALNAKSLDIYSDVRGIKTADPKIIENSTRIEEMSYSEALELSYLGAKVLHRRTILPVAALNMPIRALNSNEADEQGTIINNNTNRGILKAVTSKEVVILNLKFRDNSNIEEIRLNIIQLLNAYKVNVIFINYSEIETGLVIENILKLNEILAEFNQLTEVKVNLNSTLISLVGRNLNDCSDLISRFYSTLHENRINYQNVCLSDQKICISVLSEIHERVIKLLHKEFFE